MKRRFKSIPLKQNSMYLTGYFADEKSWTKVHIVHAKSGKPICGASISDDKSFQFNASGVRMLYVECKSCKDAYLRAMRELAGGGSSSSENDVILMAHQGK